MQEKARQYLQGFLLRHGRIYPGKNGWTVAYRRWLTMVRFQHPAQQIVVQDEFDAVADAAATVDKLTGQIAELLPGWNLAPVVEAVQPHEPGEREVVLHLPHEFPLQSEREQDLDQAGTDQSFWRDRGPPLGPSPGTDPPGPPSCGRSWRRQIYRHRRALGAGSRRRRASQRHSTISATEYCC